MGDKEQTHTLFFYGTLMAPSILRRVLYGPNKSTSQQAQSTAGAGFTSHPALLEGYQRHRVRGCDYPAIIAKTGGEVKGAVVSGLSAVDVYKLDIFEGSEYHRQPCQVRLLASSSHEEGEVVKAEVYLFTASPHKLEDKEWDFEEFQREKMRIWAGEEPSKNGVNEDEDLREVDEAIAQVEEAVKERERKGRGKEDPMGGRGVDGEIGRKLSTVVNGAV